ncbi:MAG TPA: hypothetical protein VFX97_03525 [Pyrinomonadaceae bacterium]|nr:hypothetical protein [Pyrinomonadaceae bacterium]
MTSEPQVNETIARQYLLGNVDDSERERIDELIIVYPEVKQTVLLAEEDLMEAYLEGSLSATDTERFLAQYANTSALRRKLEIAEVIQRRAATQSVANKKPALEVQRLGSFVSSLWRRRRPFLIPATALAIVLGIVAIWLIDFNNRRAQERGRLNSIEQQLAQLNSPSELRNNPPGMPAVVLSPGTLRSGSGPGEVAADPNSKIVELQLSWLHARDYDTYHAVFRRVSTGETYKVPNLQLHKTSGGRVIKLRLRKELLARGQYQITLSSFAKDGSAGPVDEYTFVSIH